MVAWAPHQPVSRSGAVNQAVGMSGGQQGSANWCSATLVNPLADSQPLVRVLSAGTCRFTKEDLVRLASRVRGKKSVVWKWGHSRLLYMADLPPPGACYRLPEIPWRTRNAPCRVPPHCASQLCSLEGSTESQNVSVPRLPACWGVCPITYWYRIDFEMTQQWASNGDRPRHITNS